MAKQSRTTQGPTVVGPALMGIAFICFSVDLPGKVAAAVCHLVCALFAVVLQALPSILVTALQSPELCGLDYGHVLDFVRALLSAVPLLHCLAGVI